MNLNWMEIERLAARAYAGQPELVRRVLSEEKAYCERNNFLQTLEHAAQMQAQAQKQDILLEWDPRFNLLVSAYLLGITELDPLKSTLDPSRWWEPCICVPTPARTYGLECLVRCLPDGPQKLTVKTTTDNLELVTAWSRGRFPVEADAQLDFISELLPQMELSCNRLPQMDAEALALFDRMLAGEEKLSCFGCLPHAPYGGWEKAERLRKRSFLDLVQTIIKALPELLPREEEPVLDRGEEAWKGLLRMVSCACSEALRALKLAYLKLYDPVIFFRTALRSCKLAEPLTDPFVTEETVLAHAARQLHLPYDEYQTVSYEEMLHRLAAWEEANPQQPEIGRDLLWFYDIAQSDLCEEVFRGHEEELHLVPGDWNEDCIFRNKPFRLEDFL